MANEEERILENQLEQQLKEQNDSLSAINDALASDPTNPELLEVHEELVQAIKDAEEGLIHLKRARLLQEADLIIQSSPLFGEDVKAEPIDPATEDVNAEPLDPATEDVNAELLDPATEDVNAEPLDPADSAPEPFEELNYSVGTKCRFRYSDGRWYDGQIVGLESSNSARISFLIPTSENMLMCKFFLQQRCRFGANCRLSHGIDVPLSSLKKYVPTHWEQTLVGSTIWALSDGRVGIWRKAELESWDDEHRMGQVVFIDDGSSAKLGADAMSLSEYSRMDNEEESDLSSEESDSSEYDADGPQGLGLTSLQKGVQTETVVFAKWENHTRGIASKMMTNMGYREGMGLGASGQGMLNPISVKVLPPKQSLDHALESHESNKDIEENKGKKRSRGGKRKREKKFAAAARAAKEKDESRPDFFSLINQQLAMHGEALNGKLPKTQRDEGLGEKKKVDRRDLVAFDDEVKDLRIRVEKLEEMVKRNQKEKVVYEAVMRKLNETQKALAEAEAAHASASNAVVRREKEKKWLKF